MFSSWKLPGHVSLKTCSIELRWKGAKHRQSFNRAEQAMFAASLSRSLEAPGFEFPLAPATMIYCVIFEEFVAKGIYVTARMLRAIIRKMEPQIGQRRSSKQPRHICHPQMSATTRENAMVLIKLPHITVAIIHGPFLIFVCQPQGEADYHSP